MIFIPEIITGKITKILPCLNIWWWSSLILSFHHSLASRCSEQGVAGCSPWCSRAIHLSEVYLGQMVVLRTKWICIFCPRRLTVGIIITIYLRIFFCGVRKINWTLLWQCFIFTYRIFISLRPQVTLICGDFYVQYVKCIFYIIKYLHYKQYHVQYFFK